jgi:hypothetical protein
MELIYNQCQMDTAHCPCCAKYYPVNAAEQRVLHDKRGFHHLDSDICSKCVLPSPWCNILSEEDLKLLEYWEDLKKYWQDGYGFKLNYQPSCLMVKEFVNQFK